MYDIYSIVIIAISVVFILNSLAIRLNYSNHKQKIKEVQLYPPEEYNSAEIDFFYNGYSTTKGIASLLIYLANKGYIKIEEKAPVFFIKKRIKIIKVKEYDGDNYRESLLFNTLFKHGNNVTAADLHRRYYRCLDNIKKNFNGNKYIIFEQLALKKYKLCIIMPIILLFLIIIDSLIWKNFWLMLCTILLLVFMFSIFDENIFLWPSGIMILLLCLKPEYIKVYDIIIFLCFLILMCFGKISLRRTPFGNEVLAKIIGFKKFIKTAKKKQLEIIINEDPDYFYNILPYVYALGISDKFIKQFEKISVSPPSWYITNKSFDMNSFGKFMSNIFPLIQASMISMPATVYGRNYKYRW